MPFIKSGEVKFDQDYILKLKQIKTHNSYLLRDYFANHYLNDKMKDIHNSHMYHDADERPLIELYRKQLDTGYTKVVDQHMLTNYEDKTTLYIVIDNTGYPWNNYFKDEKTIELDQIAEKADISF